MNISEIIPNTYKTVSKSADTGTALEQVDLCLKAVTSVSPFQQVLSMDFNFYEDVKENTELEAEATVIEVDEKVDEFECAVVIRDKSNTKVFTNGKIKVLNK